jgi:hypothetical protein
LAEKENVCRYIDSNHQIKAQLQNQVQNFLWHKHDQDKGM